MVAVAATLVLCGSTLSPHFARNMCFSLEGNSTDLSVSASFNLEVPLYAPTDITLPVSPPYTGSAEYEVHVAENEPSPTVKFAAHAWRDVACLKVPRRMFLDKPVLEVSDSSPVAELPMTIACLSLSARSYWLIFMHPEVGDFIIKLTINPKTMSKPTPLTVWVSPLICSKSVDNWVPLCVPLPCRNYELWDAIRTMFKKTLDPAENDFWMKHLDTNIGLRLVQWMLGDSSSSESEEFKHIFNTEVTYNVKVSHPNEIRLSKRITITDVRALTDLFVPMLVDWDKISMTAVELQHDKRVSQLRHRGGLHLIARAVLLRFISYLLRPLCLRCSAQENQSNLRTNHLTSVRMRCRGRTEQTASLDLE
uniref:Uncharacterized protein n=1 Tax=Timema poppense TaxID=170557 RepID=A0A7R9HDF4_TIMPO|nr:unnamed protein product [Timema poppensis]